LEIAKKAAARAWATVNAHDGGKERLGSQEAKKSFEFDAPSIYPTPVAFSRWRPIVQSAILQ